MNSKKFDEDFVNFLINSKESKTLDFKQKVTSKKKITGIDPEEEKYMVESANEIYCFPRVSLSCKPYFMPDADPEKKNKNEKFLLIVEIKKTAGPKIFTSDKMGNRKLYIRVDDQTRLIP